MKAAMLSAVISLVGTHATALSCLRPDPVETFQRLAAEPDHYFAIYGTLTFDEAALPEGSNDFDNQTVPDPIPAFFEGKGLSAEGFVTPYISNVELLVTCAGPWCGTARSGGKAVYFVPASPPPVTLQAGPCGGMIFDDPAPEVLEMLASCMQGRTCTPFQPE